MENQNIEHRHVTRHVCEFAPDCDGYDDYGYRRGCGGTYEADSCDACDGIADDQAVDVVEAERALIREAMGLPLLVEESLDACFAALDPAPVFMMPIRGTNPDE